MRETERWDGIARSYSAAIREGQGLPWDPARGPVLRKQPMLLALLAACSALIVAGMVRVGALDHPVARSSHTIPTPKGGGVGIVAAFALGIAAMHPAGAADAVLAAAAIGLAIAKLSGRCAAMGRSG